MKEVYIIWNKSFEYGEICISNSIAYITENYNTALHEFEKYKKICKDTYNDSRWCYSYSLEVCYLDTYPLKEETLFEIDNLQDEETSIPN